MFLCLVLLRKPENDGYVPIEASGNVAQKPTPCLPGQEGPLESTTQFPPG